LPTPQTADRLTDEIDATVARVQDDLVALRRDLHRHPELSGQERRTAAAVAERLRAAGMRVRTGVGGHGVVGVLDGGGTGPTIAYRADMDALAADETFESDFASQTPGAAHLCGHDVHTAVGVGVAEVLARLRDHVNGTLVFQFQPAEESLTGARAMLADGVLADPAWREIYALHCAPLPVGTLAVMPGVGLPGLDDYRVDLTGPHASQDAERLVDLIGSLGTVHPPQTPDDFARLLADLQTPDGPLARFTFSHAEAEVHDDGAVRVRGWHKTWPDEQYAPLREEVRRAVDGVEGAAAVFSEAPFPAMVCSPELSHDAAAVLRRAVGDDAVTALHAAWPFSAEDFALFLQRVPGAMFYLGVANPEAGITGVLHSPGFAADDHAVGIGVRAMARLLVSRLDASPEHLDLTRATDATLEPTEAGR
jgi:metal-dependent amidase/aminoacylase/carboxypeptidase family protein